MGGERFRLRRGSVNSNIPASEHLGISEPIHDPDTGSLGIGCGEQNPRYYPGVNANGDLVLQEGQRILSNDDPTTHIALENGFFTVTVKNKVVLKVSDNADAIFDSVTLSDTLKFDQLATVDYPTVPGFAYKDGKLTITCPLEILGSLNLSLSDFANGIIPTNDSVGDIFVGGGAGQPRQWKSADTLVSSLSKLAPLLYRSANRNSRTLDMSFGSIPMYFGQNEDRKGAFSDTLVSFLNLFGSSFSRDTPGYFFNNKGVLTQAPTNEPRLGFDPYTGKFLGIKIEGATQNFITNSNTFSDYAATNMNAVTLVSANWGAKGLRNPVSLSEQNTGEHYLEKTFTNRLYSQAYAHSIFVELPSSNAVVRLQLSVYAGSNKFSANFMLNSTNGTVTDSGVTGSASLKSTHVKRISDTIYRIGVAGVLDPNSSSTSTLKTRIQGLNSANLTSYTSVASGIAYIGEAMFEPRSRVTSLLPTNGQTAARSSDNFLINFNNYFNFTAFKNNLGIKFISDNYLADDPIFTLYNNDYSATLKASSANSISLSKGPVASQTNNLIGTIDNTDQVTYEYDCTGHPLNSYLAVGANSDFSKHFNGWLTLIYLYR